MDAVGRSASEVACIVRPTAVNTTTAVDMTRAVDMWTAVDRMRAVNVTRAVNRLQAAPNGIKVKGMWPVVNETSQVASHPPGLRAAAATAVVTADDDMQDIVFSLDATL